MGSRQVVLIAGLALVVSGIICTFFLTYPNSTGEKIWLLSEDGTRISAYLFTPRGLSADAPAIIVCHGFSANKEFMQGISTELVKRGFRVIAIDFRGHGDSGGGLGPGVVERNFTKLLQGVEKDATAAISYLRKMGINRIGLVGHSMGGATVSSLGCQDPLINATVAIGIGGGYVSCADATHPRNLLIAVGAWDEFVSVDDALSFLSNATNGVGKEKNVLYGNLADGTARKLVISPLTNHLLEPFDVVILNETVAWFEDVFYGRVRYPIHITEPFRDLAIFVALFGGALSFASVASYISPIAKSFKIEKMPIKKRKYATYLVAYVTAGILGILIGGGIAPLLYWIPVDLGSAISGLFVASALTCFLSYLFVVCRERKNICFSLTDLYLSKNNLRSVAYGMICWLYAFFVICAVSSWSLTHLIPTARQLVIFALFVALFFPHLLIDEIWFRALVQPKIPGRYKEVFGSAAFSISAKSIWLILVAIIVGGFFVLVASALAFLFILASLSSAWIFYHSRNILAPTVINTLLFAWAVSIWLPFI